MCRLPPTQLESFVDHFIPEQDVRDEEAAAAAERNSSGAGEPMDVSIVHDLDKEDVALTCAHMQTSEAHARSVAPATSTAADADDPDLWRRALPRAWHEYIDADRRIATVGAAPYSDAYLTGMTESQRKVIVDNLTCLIIF